MNNITAITIGDLKGIGIKLLIKEWKNKKINNFVLITNLIIFKKYINFPTNKINIINSEKELRNYNKKKLNIYNIKTRNIYTNAFESLENAYLLTKKKLFNGIITLPLNKKEINKFVKKSFIDQTTFFSKLEKINNSNMIFIHKNKYFVPLTIHIEIKKVASHFRNKNFIFNKILSLVNTMKNDFDIENPKIAIAGINPHAGEDGLISNEDKKLILPILNLLRKKNIYINGPYAGDSIINKNNLNKYDAFVFTFHDQALIPFKLISNFEGVNFTSNLNIIRLSPSHGTARDIINKNIATSNGLLNCFKLIKQINKNRKN